MRPEDERGLSSFAPTKSALRADGISTGTTVCVQLWLDPVDPVTEYRACVARVNQVMDAKGFGPKVDDEKEPD